MSMTIAELSIGDQARITGFQKGMNTTYRTRLLAMGMTRGELFQVKRVAPLGDPVEVTVRGFSLMLRKDEARAILVEKG